jgi:hypothetical protein
MSIGARPIRRNPQLRWRGASEGTLDDIARAAPMRQRAWPESVVTEEGMRHWIAGVPRTALLLESHSRRRAAELGATIALTDNDETNAPMLAVNQRLGYRPFTHRLEWERAAATSAP